MVREATWRVKKYGAKIDPDAVRIRFEKQGEDMKTQQQARLSELAELQGKVRNILNSHGVNPAFTMPYMAVSNELYGLSRRFNAKTFANEAIIVLDKWKARGCLQAVLTDIAALFGVTYPPS